MSSPRDTLDDVRFSELVNEGSDIPAVADRLKSIAAAEREMGRGRPSTTSCSHRAGGTTPRT